MLYIWPEGVKSNRLQSICVYHNAVTTKYPLHCWLQQSKPLVPHVAHVFPIYLPLYFSCVAVDCSAPVVLDMDAVVSLCICVLFCSHQFYFWVVQTKCHLIIRVKKVGKYEDS